MLALSQLNSQFDHLYHPPTSKCLGLSLKEPAVSFKEISQFLFTHHSLHAKFRFSRYSACTVTLQSDPFEPKALCPLKISIAAQSNPNEWKSKINKIKNTLRIRIPNRGTLSKGFSKKETTNQRRSISPRKPTSPPSPDPPPSLIRT
jgi:hypothetical protein